jgi:tetratricopeptide (TPR) repeat protein
MFPGNFQEEWKMKKSLLAMALIVCCGLFFAACASAPTAEINATKAAVTTAQTDDVRTYAGDSLQAAEDEMNKALAEVQTQDGKFFVSRDYKQASAMLKSAKDLAEKAESDAQANKAKAKSDAEATLAALPQSIEEARKALAKAPKGKDTRADIEAMQNDLKVAEESMNEANTAMSQGQYKDALTKAESAREKTSAIIEQVQKAQEKVRGRR